MSDTKKSEPAKPANEPNELEKLKAELAAKEAELNAREKALAEEGEALKEMRANIDAAPSGRPSADTGVGLMETDIDLKDAPPEVVRGMDPKATADDKKAYSKWVREHYKGHTPLKTFKVVIKKHGSDDKLYSVKAVDEGDARRRAYKRAGIEGKTEGYNATVTRVMPAAAA